MGLTQAYGSGGSAQSATNGSQSQGYSINYPLIANANAAENARIAFERQKELQQIAMDFNREEAQKSRDWETEMANTIYTRSVKNMKEAGINPVLAAGMGLSGAGVSSGATASISGGNAPLSQTFMGSESANSAKSWGESQGSSWNNSESGLMTFLSAMGTWVEGMIGAVSSSKSIDIAIKGLDELFKDENGKTPSENYNDYTSESGSGKYSDYQNKMKSNNKEAVGDNKFLQFLNGLQLKATGLK